MPRSSNPSNFTSDNHTLYAGWVTATAKVHLGDAVQPIADDDGNWTPNLLITFAPGVEIRLTIPSPPDGWNLLDAMAPPKLPLDEAAP